MNSPNGMPSNMGGNNMAGQGEMGSQEWVEIIWATKEWVVKEMGQNGQMGQEGQIIQKIKWVMEQIKETWVYKEIWEWVQTRIQERWAAKEWVEIMTKEWVVKERWVKRSDGSRGQIN